MQIQCALIAISCLVVVSVFHLTWYWHYLYYKFIDWPPQNGSQFDFIVVGSGSAGSVVAGKNTGEMLQFYGKLVP